jgi:hypothetical protein
VTEPQEPRGAAPAHLTPDELSECAFSPETAPAGLLEHAEGCPDCAAELADLRLLLTELAALPEPELPESVAIRMDAAVARAWQEVDAEQEAAADRSAASARRGRRPSWRKIAIPLSALSLIVLAIVGVGEFLAHDNTTNTTASSSAGVAENGPGVTPERYGPLTNSTVLAWVHSVLPTNGTHNSSGPMISPKVEGGACAAPGTPQLPGYTVLTTSHREYEGQAATLVVYQNTKEPASPTVYAVVYAGSCPSSTSGILAAGSVSR